MTLRPPYFLDVVRVQPGETVGPKKEVCQHFANGLWVADGRWSRNGQPVARKSPARRPVEAIRSRSQGGGTGSNPVGAAETQAGQRLFFDLLARLAKPQRTRPANGVPKTSAPQRQKKQRNRAWRVSAAAPDDASRAVGATSTRRLARPTTEPALGPTSRGSPS